MSWRNVIIHYFAFRNATQSPPDEQPTVGTRSAIFISFSHRNACICFPIQNTLRLHCNFAFLFITEKMLYMPGFSCTSAMLRMAHGRRFICWNNHNKFSQRNKNETAILRASRVRKWIKKINKWKSVCVCVLWMVACCADAMPHIQQHCSCVRIASRYFATPINWRTKNGRYHTHLSIRNELGYDDRLKITFSSRIPSGGTETDAKKRRDIVGCAVEYTTLWRCFDKKRRVKMRSRYRPKRQCISSNARSECRKHYCNVKCYRFKHRKSHLCLTNWLPCSPHDDDNRTELMREIMFLAVSDFMEVFEMIISTRVANDSFECLPDFYCTTSFFCRPSVLHVSFLRHQIHSRCTHSDAFLAYFCVAKKFLVNFSVVLHLNAIR